MLKHTNSAELIILIVETTARIRRNLESSGRQARKDQRASQLARAGSNLNFCCLLVIFRFREIQDLGIIFHSGMMLEQSFQKLSHQ